MNTIENIKTIHLPSKLRKLAVYELGSDFNFNGYCVPAGFKTDGASIPWLFRRWFPSVSACMPAAIVHDLHCELANLDKDYISRRKGDAIFYNNCVNALGRPKLEALFLYAGASIGSFIAYFRYKYER